MVQKLPLCRSRFLAANTLVVLGILAALVASTLPTVVSANLIGSGIDINDPQLFSQDEYVLSCDATLATAGGETMYESREDMELEFEEPAAPTPQPTAMPSATPSLAMPCSDPFSNARGSYTSTKAPCTITFHNEDEGDNTVNHLGANRKRYHDNPQDEVNSSYYRGTSNVCSSENKIGEAKEYVSSWPDECVGDFARCYDLRDPNYRMCQGLKKILAGVNDDFRELQQGSAGVFLPWEIRTRDIQDGLVPPGTTHVSVDCTVDKEALIESYQQALELHHEMIEENIAATKKQTLFVVVSVLIAVLIVIYAIALLVVQPIVGAIGDAGGRRQQDGIESVSTRGRGQIVSLGSRHSSSSSNHESLSRSSGLRLDVGIAHDEEEGTRHHITQDDIRMLERPEDVVPSESTIEQTQQIPLDFDAVPIVPATIIPFDAIHAEVMEDGIVYSH